MHHPKGAGFLRPAESIDGNSKCTETLPCGHLCPEQNHPYHFDHASIKCMQQCSKTCHHYHQCKAACYKDCPPCLVFVMNVMSCGHEGILPCHFDTDKTAENTDTLKPNMNFVYKPDSRKHACTVKVKKQLQCGHEAIVECGATPDEDVWCSVEIDVIVPDCFHVEKVACSNFEMPKCSQKCGRLISCGHACRLHCHRRSGSNCNCEEGCNPTNCVKNFPVK